MIAQRRPSQPTFTDLKMSSIVDDNVVNRNKSNWIEPWSKAVSQAAEDQKKSHRRRNSFLTQSKHQSTIIQQSNVFENASRLPSPPVLQRIFFSPHPDDIAYSAFGTASKKPRCCHHDDDDEETRSNASTSSSSYKKQSHLRVQREDSGIALPSPSLSASSKFSDDATLVATPSYASSVSSTSSGSRRNSSVDLKTNTQNALIVTVFSKSRCANGDIGARLNRNVEDTTSLRTDEDEQFARSIGCDLLQLGFPDSSARDEPSRRPDLAELAMTKHLPGQKIRHVDHYIFEDVRKSLEPIVWMAIRAGAKIHLPLGVGCHVDHWMVRVAVLSILDELDVKLGQTTNMLSEPLKEIFSTHLIGGQEPLHERLIFYEDLPYADAQTNSHVEQLAKAVLPLGAKARLVHLTENDWCKKRAAILAYASQMKPTILPSLYNHATRLAQLGKTIDPEFDSTSHHQVAERIWVIDAKLRRKLAFEQEEKQ